MDLMQLVSSECGVDREQAGRGLGSLFTAVRMAINLNEHAQLKEAFPALDQWLGRTSMGGGRTGEMLAIMGPEAIRRNLEAAGFSEDNIPKICAIVGRALREKVPDIAAKVADRVPLLKA